MTHDRDGSPCGLALHLADEAATLRLGQMLARALQGGEVVWLEGELGSGKTTLVRGVLRGFGYSGRVKSPTYTLVELYVVSRLNLYHFDFFRFNQPRDYLDAGLDEYFQSEAICLVEWPEKASPYVPAPDVSVRLAVEETGRAAVVRANTERGERCLGTLAPLAAAFRHGDPRGEDS